MADWQIEPLSDHHQREVFSCGKAPLDVFIQLYAGQYERKGIGRTFVAARAGEKAVVGYYTLAVSTIEFAHLPTNHRKKLPKHPAPAILIGRLAVDMSISRKGLGSVLMSDALSRALRIADELGVFAVHTHTIDDDAAGFYAKFGFATVPDQERHMFLPMATIRAGSNASGT